MDGAPDGLCVGPIDGHEETDGTTDGADVGHWLGVDGTSDGDAVGATDGTALLALGHIDGAADGSNDDDIVGGSVG